jgi:hypothetical protein
VATKKLFNESFICLFEQCPKIVSSVSPLLNGMVLKPKSGSNIDYYYMFFLCFLIAQACIFSYATNYNIPWNKTLLVPKITNGPVNETTLGNSLKGFPRVKKKGSFNSIDMYMET